MSQELRHLVFQYQHPIQYKGISLHSFTFTLSIYTLCGIEHFNIITFRCFTWNGTRSFTPGIGKSSTLQIVSYLSISHINVNEVSCLSKIVFP